MTDIEKLVKETATPADIFATAKQTYDETTRPSIDTIYQKVRHIKKKTAEQNGHSLTTNLAHQIVHLDNLVTDNDDFVRTTIRTGGKRPTAILYTDGQVDDIKNMCCTGQTVLGVNKTFNLCKMHVTMTCYKQLTVLNDKTDEHPLFLGPMFLHDNSDYETFSYFFHHLKLKLGTHLAKLVIGTDDEQAMVKAITTEFPTSTHVLCTRHLKENTRQHLIDDGVSLSDRQMVMTNIFGTDSIVNSTDDTIFENKCQDLVEYCDDITDKFKYYFNRRLRQNLRSDVNLPMREGSIPSDWTNNNSESINRVLKQTVR